ncbi:MAG: hypothetical protein WCO10_01640 [bacterium]
MKIWQLFLMSFMSYILTCATTYLFLIIYNEQSDSGFFASVLHGRAIQAVGLSCILLFVLTEFTLALAFNEWFKRKKWLWHRVSKIKGEKK